MSQSVLSCIQVSQSSSSSLSSSSSSSVLSEFGGSSLADAERLLALSMINRSCEPNVLTQRTGVGALCFSAIIDAILLYTTVAVVPMRPDVEKTKGEKDPCSISLTRSSYALFFSISFRR